MHSWKHHGNFERQLNFSVPVPVWPKTGFFLKLRRFCTLCRPCACVFHFAHFFDVDGKNDAESIFSRRSLTLFPWSRLEFLVLFRTTRASHFCSIAHDQRTDTALEAWSVVQQWNLVNTLPKGTSHNDAGNEILTNLHALQTPREWFSFWHIPLPFSVKRRPEMITFEKISNPFKAV